MYTIEELVDVIQSDITVSCSLPKLLPDVEIRRIIETNALNYFYRAYPYALIRSYYYVPKEYFATEQFTKYKTIQLPCEIQNVIWVHEIRQSSLFNIGINAPNLSIGLGVSNQPYLSSAVTSIGEIGVYKVLLDSFSDMLDQLSKFTVKNSFNKLNHTLNILTSLNYDLVLEVYVNIEQEALFSDDLFIKYVTAISKKQLGAIMGRFNFKLPGGIQYNYGDLIAEGKEEMQQVTDEIKSISNSSFMFMVRR